MKKYKKLLTLASLAGLAIALTLGLRFLRRGAQGGQFSLIYIPKTTDWTNDFWTSLISGVRLAAQEFGTSLEVIAPEREQDIERQNEILSEAIARRPDALLISPSSFTASTQLLREAKEKHIPIVYIDSYAEGELQDLTVATDNLALGRKLGEYAAQLLDEDTSIAIVGHVQGVSTAVEREQGFREGLGEKARNIVEVVFCDSEFDRAHDLAMELMEKYPRLGMIVGMNEYSSVGAARAVQETGAQERIQVLGVDSSQEAIQMMEAGVFKGFVVQKAFKMGYVGVRETVRMLRGEAVERNVDSGSELVTPENLYSSEIEKLLFPFERQKGTENAQEVR